MPEVTVGIDIGTTSVKAVAADGEGAVVARTRVPHRLHVPAADLLEHDANQAWRRGVRRAWREVSADHDVRGVMVAAMVPSLCAVDRRGVALTPGLLYGDARGQDADRQGENPSASGELVGFLRWCAAQAPDAAGYWPAQAVANCALSGRGVLDTVTAMTAMPLFTGVAWDEQVAAAAGAATAQLPRIVAGSEPAGKVDGAVLGAGAIDAFAEQLVAGADDDGDVLVILGTTLITWAVTGEWREVRGLWTVPHTAPGKILIGGPSNAGGLFVNWATSIAGRVGTRGTELDPVRIPVWTPYVRGERTPLHDPSRRAGLPHAHRGGGAAGGPRGVGVRGAAPPRPRRRRAPADRGDGWRSAGHRLGAGAGGLHRAAGRRRRRPRGRRARRGVAGPGDRGAGGAGRRRRSLGAGGPPGRRVEPDSRWAVAAAERYQRFRELTAAG
jgi:xylulokinase